MLDSQNALVLSDAQEPSVPVPEEDPTVVRLGYGIFYADSTQFFHWRAYEPLPDRTELSRAAVS